MNNEDFGSPDPLEPEPEQPQPAPPAAPDQPKVKVQWKNDGKQWVAQDGSGRTRPHTADDYIAALPPEWQTIARKLQDYQIAYPTQALAREANKGGAGPWSQVLSVVSQDPTWDAIGYDAKRKAAMDFVDQGQTKPGSNITSLNTAIGHLAEYRDAAHALNNVNLPVLGKPINTAVNYAISGSDPRVGRLKTAQGALAAEMTRAFRNAAGTEGDINSWKDALSLNDGENVQMGNSDTAVHLLASRIRALRQQYKNNVGREPRFNFLNPDSREILSRLGYNSDAIESGVYGAPGGVGTPGRGGSGDGMISVQIPGQSPGRIPAANINAFLKDHPGAKVLQ